MSQLRTSEIPGPASGCIWSSSNLQIPDHCIRPSHKMHSRGNTTSDMHTKAGNPIRVGIMNKYPCTPSLFQKLLPFCFSFVFSFILLPSSLVIFYIPFISFLQLIHISIHLFSKTNTAIVHYVRFHLSFLYLFVLYVYNILYSFCTVKQCYT